MTDLLQATQDFVFALLNVPSVTVLAPVFTNVPPNTPPPFIEVGAIDAQAIGTKADELEQHSVEVEFQFRGSTRRPLLAMMSAARSAMEQGTASVSGADLEQPRWLASATDREEDGVTYHGIHRFELIAQADD